VDAQFMAVALATFFTSRTLAGNTAGAFGFNVTDTGIGAKIVNVGSKGAAFGVANNTNLTILQLLLATNSLTDLPDSRLGFAHIYDTNGDGVIDSAEAALRTMANDLIHGSTTRWDLTNRTRSIRAEHRPIGYKRTAGIGETTSGIPLLVVRLCY
jgi:hypothetical protein